MYREAGLPKLVPDDRGERHLTLGSKGVVRAVHPDLNRVDIELEDGSLLTRVQVLGPYFPPVHEDKVCPSHVAYWPMQGEPDGVCLPFTFRRLQSPTEPASPEDTEGTPERRRYDQHSYIFRSGHITTRISHDHRWVLESEEGDYIQYDENTREVRVHAPSVFIGTEKDTRIEYQQDEYVTIQMPHVYIGTETEDRIQYDESDQVQIKIPKFYFGATAQPDADGITYLPGMIHLVSTLIKLTASSIVLDPTNIKLGNANATERVPLGDLLITAINAFRTLFNTHTHGNVQNGAGTSGVPTVATPLLTDSVLSDVAHVSKTGL